MIFKATIKKVKSNKRPNGNLSDVELCAKKRERKKNINKPRDVIADVIFILFSPIFLPFSAKKSKVRRMFYRFVFQN